MATDTYVRAQIDSKTRKRAADALGSMGLSISDATRLLMRRVTDERRLPFEVKVSNTRTRKAIAELESGKDKRFATVKDLMADLHANDRAVDGLQTLAAREDKIILSAAFLT